MAQASAGVEHRTAVAERHLGEAALHVADAQDRHEAADEDDQLATVGEHLGGAGGLDGVGEPGGVGAEEFCQYVGVKCLDQLVNSRFEDSRR